MQWITLTTATFCIIIIFLIKKMKISNNKKIQKDGLVHICQIKRIIIFAQQHRGLTAAWLNGDTNAEAKLTGIKKLISQEINSLMLSPVAKNERWAAFTDHWGRLLSFNNKSSVSNSFEQHTMMIKNLAYLLEDTAESSHLTADFLPKINNIGYVWRELILTTENIGQSRAIGVSVAVQQCCSSVDRIRLNFLIQTMAKTTIDTLQRLSHLPEEHHTHTNLVKKATESMNKLIEVMTSELVGAAKVAIDSNQYFELATETMSKMNDIFDHQVKQLNKVI
ncbi:nitrate- and nitrite sensing domain-containing protein [Pseudoalteromonas sp. 1_2015MBL_MicDiv]|uniref:nitrate- and nitrite sensing domain-containing protein n=1 Tax=Pseudoalteromonas sp. 1_2015MBL_MicDiv TaxID=1720343 RepID=UPI000BBE59F2|nr:nitrate- and nitrite sensing domain-containing protein [Pseudoalteromonas sp. 1_2015MBL_MicDiv]ATG78021.1 hypothetical protein AOR04_11010 [Pseudoalteromonas sp. 1_2015MBL_MicDiv]